MIVFIFLILSVGLLLAVLTGLINSILPWLTLKKDLKNSNYQRDKALTNIDALIGKKGVVVSEIGIYKNGRVRISGETWLAKSADDQAIKAGDIVEIVGVSGCHVAVKAAVER